MPANKNAMTRYRILDELLSDRYHNYSLDDLTNVVNIRLSEIYPETNGVVRRTIEKDIFYLEYEGPFMAEIDRYSATCYDRERQKNVVKQCLRYTNPSYSIFKKEMTDDEKYLLREAMSLLGQFDGLPSLTGLENLRLGIGADDDDRKIISLAKNPVMNSNILGELFTAISQRQVIELHYHTFHKPGEPLKVRLYPYQLKEYNRRWYLIAAAESDGKLLNFSLDRIDKCVPLPSHAYIEYEGDINERFEDIVGVTYNDDSPVYQIKFWVSDISMDFVETKPIHDSQKHISGKRAEALRLKYPSLQGGRFFEIECRDNYELIRELSSFGKELIVISPSCIRQKIYGRATSMVAEYDKLRT